MVRSVSAASLAVALAAGAGEQEIVIWYSAPIALVEILAEVGGSGQRFGVDFNGDGPVVCGEYDIAACLDRSKAESSGASE